MNTSPDQMTARERMLGALWGSVAGDALGVPVEFKARDEIRANPVIGMRGYGTHHQPPGTWSDDSSLLLCTVDSLVTEEFNLDDMGRRFVGWFRDFLWTPHGEAFDVGMATADALIRIERGTTAAEAGGRGDYDNGNGSLMRIIPVALRFAATPRDVLLDRVQRASAITHAPPRSRLACALHALLVTELLHGTPANHAWDLSSGSTGRGQRHRKCRRQWPRIGKLRGCHTRNSPSTAKNLTANGRAECSHCSLNAV